MAELESSIMLTRLSAEDHNCKFATDVISNVLQNLVFWDLTFICQGSSKISTNKLLLASVSELIRDIISTTNQDLIYINLPDVDPLKLQTVLNILYHGVTKVIFVDLIFVKDIINLLGIRLFNTEIKSIEYVEDTKVQNSIQYISSFEESDVSNIGSSRPTSENIVQLPNIGNEKKIFNVTFGKKHLTKPEKMILEEAFKNNESPNVDVINNLSKELGVQYKSINSWFKSRQQRKSRENYGVVCVDVTVSGSTSNVNDKNCNKTVPESLTDNINSISGDDNVMEVDIKSSDNNVQSSGKRKKVTVGSRRKKTQVCYKWTDDQLIWLEKLFQIERYPDYKKLSKDLGVNCKHIFSWFESRRQKKDKCSSKKNQTVTELTVTQKLILEEEFKINKYPNCKVISKQLGVSKECISAWFELRRSKENKSNQIVTNSEELETAVSCILNVDGMRDNSDRNRIVNLGEQQLKGFHTDLTEINTDVSRSRPCGEEEFICSLAVKAENSQSVDCQMLEEPDSQFDSTNAPADPLAITVENPQSTDCDIPEALSSQFNGIEKPVVPVVNKIENSESANYEIPESCDSQFDGGEEPVDPLAINIENLDSKDCVNPEESNSQFDDEECVDPLSINDENFQSTDCGKLKVEKNIECISISDSDDDVDILDDNIDNFTHKSSGHADLSSVNSIEKVRDLANFSMIEKSMLDETQKWIFCVHCKKKFTHLGSMKAHSCEYYLQYRCDNCDASFKKPKLLYAHRKVHHEKLYTCNICNVKITRRILMEKHIKKHYNTGVGSATKTVQNFTQHTVKLANAPKDSVEIPPENTDNCVSTVSSSNILSEAFERSFGNLTNDSADMHLVGESSNMNQTAESSKDIICDVDTAKVTKSMGLIKQPVPEHLLKMLAQHFSYVSSVGKNVCHQTFDLNVEVDQSSSSGIALNSSNISGIRSDVISRVEEPYIKDEMDVDEDIQNINFVDSTDVSSDIHMENESSEV